MKQALIIAQNTFKALIRKKDFYVFFMMLIILLAFLVSESFFGIRDISRYVKDIGFFCVWLFSLIIAVTFSARQLPEEIDSKTVLPLLAKPVSRLQFITGRFLGSLIASSVAYTIFYILYICVVFLKGEGIALPLLFQSYVFGICFLTMVCAVSIFLSILFTLSAAITLSFIIYFVITWFADGLRTNALLTTGLNSIPLTIVYYLIPHYEFYDLRIRLVHSWEALPLWVFFAALIYATLYTSIVLYLGYIKLKKRVF